jgi:hypothetical protein
MDRTYLEALEYKHTMLNVAWHAALRLVKQLEIDTRASGNIRLLMEEVENLEQLGVEKSKTWAKLVEAKARSSQAS